MLGRKSTEGGSPPFSRETQPMTDNDRTIETRYDAVDWDALLAEVQSRFNYLRIAWRTSTILACRCGVASCSEELYLPCIELLAQFCAAIEVEEESSDETPEGKI
jgi:hypothetical protein